MEKPEKEDKKKIEDTFGSETIKEEKSRFLKEEKIHKSPPPLINEHLQSSDLESRVDSPLYENDHVEVKKPEQGKGGRVAALAAMLQNANIVLGPAALPKKQTKHQIQDPEKEDEEGVGERRGIYGIGANHPWALEAERTIDPTKTVRRAKPDTIANKALPARHYVVAMYAYAGGGSGEDDLVFEAGDRIEVIKRTEKQCDWWTGRLNGRVGVFPGNYVRELDQ